MGDGAQASRSTWHDAHVLTKVNVAQCETQLPWQRGEFHAATFDLPAALGGCVIGASMWETKAGSTQGPYHYHAASRSGCTSSLASPFCAIHPASELEAGTLVAFGAGPNGAHTLDGPGRVVMFSVGARGWGEAFTSVYWTPTRSAVSRRPVSAWRCAGDGPSRLSPRSRRHPRAPARRSTCDRSHPTGQGLSSGCIPRPGPPPCTSSAPAKRSAATTTTAVARIGRSCSTAHRPCATPAARTSCRPATSSALRRTKAAPTSCSTLPTNRHGC